VLAQSALAGFEVETVIVDDGSTDGTACVCDSYAGRPGVVIVHKENGGLSSARNAGIEASSGDFLMFLDGDDYLVYGALRRLVSVAAREKGDFDFIQFRYAEVPGHDRRLVDAVPPVSPVPYRTVTDRRAMYAAKLTLGGIGASACTKMLNRNRLGPLRFKEGIIHEDEQFTTMLISRSSKVLYVDSELYCYVKRPGSIITAGYTHKKLDIIPVLEEQIDILRRDGCHDLAEEVRSRLVSNLCILYVKARRAGENADARFIKGKASAMLCQSPVRVDGNLRYVVKGMSMHLPALQAYYLYYRLKGFGD